MPAGKAELRMSRFEQEAQEQQGAGRVLQQD